MDRIETVLNEACEDQRDALRRFHETGSPEDASHVHYEACPTCDRALDAIVAMRADLPAVVPDAVVRGNRPWIVALYLSGWAGVLGIAGFIVYLMGSAYFAGREEAVTELGRIESSVQFVRMPGRPEMCVAAIRGDRGYGPTFLGAEACSWVRERIVSDEGLSWALRDYVVTRIRGTPDTCLAHALHGRQDFTLPCGGD